MKLIVTGGAGFIGSSFVRMALGERWAEHVVNLDVLTYAGNLDNVEAVSRHPGYRFVQADICDEDAVAKLFAVESPDAVVHFAAESHVDRSIHSPLPAITTNFNGTFTLLEAARRNKIARFVHVSTDEVYGSIEPPHEADENYPLRASSPYSSSKAGSDLLALSYHTTYKLNVSVTRASNNYGPFQFPEEADTAHDFECARRQAAPGLRRWSADPGLAVRGRSLSSHTLRSREGRAWRDL